MATTRLKWALAYLRGRVGGFQRGTLPIAAVQTATDIALKAGASREEVEAILDAARLARDPETGSVVRLDRRTP